jgi:hypothetical protein
MAIATVSAFKHQDQSGPSYTLLLCLVLLSLHFTSK